MKTIRPILAVYIIIVLGLASCTIWSSRDWARLENRRFYFNHLNYGNKGAGRKNALKVMMQIPVTDIMKCVSAKYGIEIDMSYYQAFKKKRDYKKIKGAGIFQNAYYHWYGPVKSGNIADLEYLQMDEDGTEYQYTLTLKTNGKNRAVLMGTVGGIKGMVRELAVKTNCSRMLKKVSNKKGFAVMPVKADSEKRSFTFSTEKDYKKAMDLLKKHFTIIQDAE